MAVREQFEKISLLPVLVELGEVETKEEPSEEQFQILNRNLEQLGFEIIDDRKSQLIEQIKNAIVALIHSDQNRLPKTNFSDFIAFRVNYDYNYLSNLFSEVEGTTIEKYIIAQRIEKVKELLTYDELSLSQIADLLGYSSAAYLSNQFKKQTGFTPSFYKSQTENHRKNLDEL